MNFDRNAQFRKDYEEIFFNNPCPLYLKLTNNTNDRTEKFMCEGIYWRAMNRV